MFGRGWNASVEQRLRLDGDRIVEIRLPDGQAQYYFDDNADGIYEAALPVTKDSWVEKMVGVGYRRFFRAGQGQIKPRLLKIRDGYAQERERGYGRVQLRMIKTQDLVEERIRPTQTCRCSPD